MKRRELVVLFCGAVIWPLTGRAQQLKVAKIGVLVAGAPDPQPFWTTFRQALHDLGYRGTEYPV